MPMRTPRFALAATALVLTLPTACAAPAAGPPPTSTTTAPTACEQQLTTYLADFLAGRPELGDYQELGLSSAEAQALRDLKRRAAALTPQAPLPPDWAAANSRTACAEIARAEATASAKPPGWP